MNDGHKFIGFDLGAESGRCIVSVLKDQKIILHEVHRFKTHNYHNDSGFHWDISKIQNEIIEGIKKAASNFGSSFDGISVDTWGVDYVFIDKNGEVLSDPFHYRDGRTDLMMDEAFKIVPKEKLYGKTGIQFAQYNTLFQLLAEKRSGNNLLNAADKMLLMPDFLNYTLSGIKAADFSIASTTSLDSYYQFPSVF